MQQQLPAQPVSRYVVVLKKTIRLKKRQKKMAHIDLSDLSDLSDLEDLSGGFRSADQLTGGTEEFDRQRAKELAERVKAMAPNARGNVNTPEGRKLLIDSMALSGGKGKKKIGPEKYGDKADDMLLGAVRRTPYDNRRWQVGLGYVNGRWKKQWFPTTFNFARMSLGCDFSCDDCYYGPRDICPLTIPSCCKERYEYLPWCKAPGSTAAVSTQTTTAPKPPAVLSAQTNVSANQTATASSSNNDSVATLGGGMHIEAMKRATNLRKVIRGAVDPRVQVLVNHLQPVFERVNANRGARCRELCEMAKRAYEYYAATVRPATNLGSPQKEYARAMLAAAAKAMQHHFHQHKFNDYNFCHKLVQKLER